MGGGEISFKDKKVNKKELYKDKKLFKIEDIHINKILVSKKESYGKKGSQQYFIGYNDIKPLCTMLPLMIGYVKCFDGNKTMSFIADNKELFKKIY